MTQQEGTVISTDDEEAKRLRRSGEVPRMCAPRCRSREFYPNDYPRKRVSRLRTENPNPKLVVKVRSNSTREFRFLGVVQGAVLAAWVEHLVSALLRRYSRDLSTPAQSLRSLAVGRDDRATS